MAKDEKLQIRISQELKNALKKEAEKENRTLSNYILPVLQRNISQKDER